MLFSHIVNEQRLKRQEVAGQNRSARLQIAERWATKMSIISSKFKRRKNAPYGVQKQANKGLEPVCSRLPSISFLVDSQAGDLASRPVPFPY